MTPGTQQTSNPGKVCSLVQTCSLENSWHCLFHTENTTGAQAEQQGKAAARRAEPPRRDEHCPGPTAAAPARPSHPRASLSSSASPAQPFLTVTPHGCVPRRSGEVLPPAAAPSSRKAGGARRTRAPSAEAAGG